MAKLKATGKKVGGHEYVYADPEDEFWKAHGYVPVEEGEDGDEEEVALVEEDTDADAEVEPEPEEEVAALVEEGEEGEDGEGGEEEVDLDAMTIPELEAWVEANEVPVHLSEYRLKSEKIAAITAALTELEEDETESESE